MKVRVVDDLSKLVSVFRLCRLYLVSRRGTLARLTRSPSKQGRQQRQTCLSRHAATYPDSYLGRNFSLEDASLQWVTGISYVLTENEWLVVSVVMDLHSLKITRWSFRSRMDSTITTRALAMADHQRKGTAGVLVHSDRELRASVMYFKSRLWAIRLC